MSARDELAAARRGFVQTILDESQIMCDPCGPDDYCPSCRREAEHVTDALLASPALANLIREKHAEARQAGQIDCTEEH